MTQGEREVGERERKKPEDTQVCSIVTKCGDLAMNNLLS